MSDNFENWLPLLKVLKPAEEVTYQVFQENDPRFQKEYADGTRRPDGIKLKVLLSLLKGDEGEVRGPRNEWYPLSLKSWVDADLDTTYLKIEVPRLAESIESDENSMTVCTIEDTQDVKCYKQEVKVFKTGESDETLLSFLPSGQLMISAVSLEDMRRRLGGDEGYHPLGHGEKYFVSLLPWKDEDLELTFVRLITYIWPKNMAVNDKIDE